MISSQKPLFNSLFLLAVGIVLDLLKKSGQRAQHALRFWQNQSPPDIRWPSKLFDIVIDFAELRTKLISVVESELRIQKPAKVCFRCHPRILATKKGEPKVETLKFKVCRNNKQTIKPTYGRGRAQAKFGMKCFAALQALRQCALCATKKQLCLNEELIRFDMFAELSPVKAHTHTF